METSALYFLGRSLNHNTLTICAILGNRSSNTYSENYSQTMSNLIDLVLEKYQINEIYQIIFSVNILGAVQIFFVFLLMKTKVVEPSFKQFISFIKYFIKKVILLLGISLMVV